MIKPINGNVLVEPLRNQTEKIFKESDSRKDLQYALVVAIPPEGVILEKDLKLEVGDKIVYNPRTLTNLVFKDKLYGMVHRFNILAAV